MPEPTAITCCCDDTSLPRRARCEPCRKGQHHRCGDTPTTDIVDDLREHPVTIAQEAADEIERLRSWKAQQLEVIASWDQVWEALGRPGRLGESKAAAVLRFIQATRGPGINYDGPEPSVECAWPPCKNRLRRVGPPSMSGADHPQWCSKGHRALSETEGARP